MKASELIIQVQALIDQYGDLPVKAIHSVLGETSVTSVTAEADWENGPFIQVD